MKDLTTVTFDGSNYEEFAAAARGYLELKGLWYVIEEKNEENQKNKKNKKIQKNQENQEKDQTKEIQKEELATTGKSSSFKMDDTKAMGFLRMKIVSTYHDAVGMYGWKSAYEAWEKIKELGVRNLEINMITWRRQLDALKYRCGESIDVYLGEAERLKRLLKETSAPVVYSELAMRVLNGLPKDWNAFVSGLQSIYKFGKDEDENLLVWQQVRSELISHSLVVLKLQTTDDFIPAAMTIQRKKKLVSKRFSGKCFNCSKLGHKSADCWAAGGGKAGQGPKQTKYKGRAEQDTKDGDGFSSVFNVTDNLNYYRENGWLIDSGASDHMCAEKEIVTDFKECSEHVYLADNNPVKAIGRGTVTLTVWNGYSINKMILTDVLVVPNIRKNLLSISKLESKGAFVTFCEGKVEIWTEKEMKKKLAIGTRTNNSTIYWLETTCPTVNSASIETGNQSIHQWHKRMGHLNYQQLQKLPKID
jgi:hypothetical protein